MNGFRSFVAAFLFLCVGHSVSAEMLCSFQIRSTIEGNDKLSDHAFRVRFDGHARTLEQRYGHGSWHSHGEVQRVDRSGFTVFVHLPTSGPTQSQAQMLTVQDSGTASLAIHHGRTGGELE